MNKYEKYPLYKAMYENWNTRENAIGVVRHNWMAYFCKQYAQANHYSPFYTELMALAALYDDCEGSPFWKENFEGKFANPEEVIISFKTKVNEWIPVHDEDVNIICIRAALNLLTQNAYDPLTIYEVGQDLYKVMVSNTQTEYTMLWVNVAIGVDFSGCYLNALEKQQSSRSNLSSERNYVKVEKGNFKDEGVYAVAKRISLSNKATIIYSYKVSAKEILARLMGALDSMCDYNSGMTCQKRYNYSITSDGSILAHGVYLGLILSLVESPDDGFSAVAVSERMNTASYDNAQMNVINQVICAFNRSYETSEKNIFFLNFGCNVEEVNLNGQWGSGFSLSKIELADAFRNSKKLEPPYTTIIDRSRVSSPNWYVQQTSGGCYVATAVYGSYDCPEVWVLRRFRDSMLMKTWHGRMFVKVYYRISPIFVDIFGNMPWFQCFWKGRLDRLIFHLQARGFDDGPYYDEIWK